MVKSVEIFTGLSYNGFMKILAVIPILPKE